MKYRDYIDTYMIPYTKLSRRTGIPEKTLAFMYKRNRRVRLTLTMCKNLIDSTKGQITWQDMIEDFA